MIHFTPPRLKSPKGVLVLLLLACASAGCNRGPRLPEKLSFEGRPLEKTTGWSRGGISGVVFVPRGEQLETASLQVGILVSTEHSSGVELHNWIMEQYRNSPTSQWYQSALQDEACKVGLAPGPRPFAALHVCRGASGVSACAEIDERLGEDVAGRCLNGSNSCWDEVCNQLWARRAAIEAEVLGVLESR